MTVRLDGHQADMRDAEHFKVGAEHAYEYVLEQLPEASPERYAPTQALLEIRRAGAGMALRDLYRDWRAREPDLTAARGGRVDALDRAAHGDGPGGDPNSVLSCLRKLHFQAADLSLASLGPCVFQSSA